LHEKRASERATANWIEAAANWIEDVGFRGRGTKTQQPRRRQTVSIRLHKKKKKKTTKKKRKNKVEWKDDGRKTCQFLHWEKVFAVIMVKCQIYAKIDHLNDD
jgi:hypothetical protein